MDITQVPPKTCTDLNTDRMLWGADRILFDANGAHGLTFSNPCNISAWQWRVDRPQYMLLNMAMAFALGGTIDNSRMLSSTGVD